MITTLCVTVSVLGVLVGLAFIVLSNMSTKVSGLMALLTDTNERLGVEEATTIDNFGFHRGVLEALCHHDEWGYSKEEVTRKYYLINGLFENMSYSPRVYKYYKTCLVCFKKIEISEEEYDAGLQAKELAAIEEDRKELEARQSKVMNS